ncbi:MAG: TRAP transporter large permease subunit [Desulfobacterales bacterium]|nr:TRAP transporter large permease subunit [Desulfobacterales bacterium]
MTAYILVSIFAAPALTRMGIGLAQAHFFAMFLSVFSFVTPPVAVGALIACSISNSSYFKTAMEAVKASFAAFLLPFMFIYVPITLLQPQETFSAIAGITACIAVLFSFQFFFVGFVFTRCSWLERLLWFTSALLFFLYILTQRFTLFAIGMSLFIFLFFGQWKNRKSD